MPSSNYARACATICAHLFHRVKGRLCFLFMLFPSSTFRGKQDPFIFVFWLKLSKSFYPFLDDILWANGDKHSYSDGICSIQTKLSWVRVRSFLDKNGSFVLRYTSFNKIQGSTPEWHPVLYAWCHMKHIVAIHNLILGRYIFLWFWLSISMLYNGHPRYCEVWCACVYHSLL